MHHFYRRAPLKFQTSKIRKHNVHISNYTQLNYFDYFLEHHQLESIFQQIWLSDKDVRIQKKNSIYFVVFVQFSFAPLQLSLIFFLCVDYLHFNCYFGLIIFANSFINYYFVIHLINIIFNFSIYVWEDIDCKWFRFV